MTSRKTEIRWLIISTLLASVFAHGDHGAHGDPDDMQRAIREGKTYAQYHMQSEHHIDNFDLPSFFKLHDLNLDGFWDEAEIEAVYGLHHHSLNGQEDDTAADKREVSVSRKKVVVDEVLGKLDTNSDGKISMNEFIAGGDAGLPTFAGFKNLGHHYDEESEYFLHHEELYHSTPETQTDESYIHPEDIEHFKHHAHIEAEEDARERHFQGLSAEADLSKDHVASDPLDEHAHAAGEGPSEDVVPGEVGTKSQATFKAGDEAPPPPPRQRNSPGAAPNRLKDGSDFHKEELEDAKRRAGDGVYDGHTRPRTAEERLRAGVPYKYKMRKGFRADEF